MAEKKYIGSGKQHETMELVDVIINIDDAQEHVFEHEGRRLLKCTVSRRREASESGYTHTVYVRPYEPKPTAEPAKAEEAPAKKRASRKRQPAKA